MYDMFQVLMICILTVVMSLIIIPINKALSFKIGAVDNPSKRRMNKVVMPTMGGVGIYVASFLSLFLFQPISNEYLLPIFISSTIIIITGVLDDIKEIKPTIKLLGIIIAALIVYYWADISIDMITVPFFGEIKFGFLSLPITIIWIIAITNAINLIDGLDGLATGVSIIALTTMGIIGFFFLQTNRVPVTILVFTVIASTVGFLPYNFHPATIYLGDTGALFLGFIISIVSLQGLKNATIISFLIPILILGIPITDTFYAIIRRIWNKKPITAADKNHMHHRLMSMGLTHRQSVLFLYLFATLFSITALIFPISSSSSILLLMGVILLGIEVFVEVIGLVSEDYKPVLTFIRRVFAKINKNK